MFFIFAVWAFSQIHAVTAVTRLPVHIGMLMPLDPKLAGLSVDGIEKRTALMISVNMINKDPTYSVELTYGWSDTDSNSKQPLTLLDSGEDVDKNDIANGDTLTPASYRTKNAQSTLCKNARKLCDNTDVMAVIGGYRSSRSIGMNHCCFKDRNLPQVSPGSTSAYLSNIIKFDNFYRTVPNDNYQGEALVNMAISFHFRKVQMIYTLDPYSKGMADKFKELWIDGSGDFSPKVNSKTDETADIRFPIDQGHHPSADDPEKTYGQVAAETVFEQGDSSVTVLLTINHDTDELMKHFGNLGMTGEGWVYLGADGTTTAKLDGMLQQEYQGFVGTSAKMPESFELWDSFVNEWNLAVHDHTNQWAEITKTPWEHKGSGAIASAFTAQMYDAVALVARGASDWYEGDGCYGTPSSCTLTRELLKAELNTHQLEFRSLGSMQACSSDMKDSSGDSISGKEECFTFDSQQSAEGGNDAHPIYTIVNAAGDTWHNLGTWTVASDIAWYSILNHKIEWPGGKTTTPVHTRPVEAQPVLQPVPVPMPVPVPVPVPSDDEGTPGWVVPIVIILILVVCCLVGGMVWLIKQEKSGKAYFSSMEETR